MEDGDVILKILTFDDDWNEIENNEIKDGAANDEGVDAEIESIMSKEDPKVKGDGKEEETERELNTPAKTSIEESTHTDKGPEKEVVTERIAPVETREKNKNDDYEDMEMEVVNISRERLERMRKTLIEVANGQVVLRHDFAFLRDWIARKRSE